MAMRTFFRHELEDILRTCGLKKTRMMTEDHRLWETEDGDYFPIPILDNYPEYLVDDILQKIGCASHWRDIWRH